MTLLRRLQVRSLCGAAEQRGGRAIATVFFRRLSADLHRWPGLKLLADKCRQELGRFRPVARSGGTGALSLRLGSRVGHRERDAPAGGRGMIGRGMGEAGVFTFRSTELRPEAKVRDDALTALAIEPV